MAPTLTVVVIVVVVIVVVVGSSCCCCITDPLPLDPVHESLVGLALLVLAATVDLSQLAQRQGTTTTPSAPSSTATVLVAIP